MPKPSRWQPPSEPFTAAHVDPLGVSSPALRRAVASGQLTRLARGVYVAKAAVPEDPAAAHVQRALALQLRRPDCLASHQSAALAWGLALPDVVEAAEGPVALTAQPNPGRRSINRADFTVTLRPLPAEHRALHPSGLVVTTPARTAVDVAATLGLPEALMVLDSAAHQLLRQAVGQSRMRRAYEDPRRLAAACRPLFAAAGIAGTRLTRRTLAEYLALADPRRESALESYSFGQFVLAGLPLPQLQVRISTPEGDFFPDFLWPEARVIGEADGLGKYREPADLERQAVRQAQLEAIDYRFVRWNSEQIYNTPWIPLNRIWNLLR